MANGRSEGYGVAVGAHHPGYHILHGVVVARWVIVSEPSHYQPGKIGERAVEPEVIEYAFHLIYRLGYVLDEEDIAGFYYVKGGGYESGYDGKVASGEDGWLGATTPSFDLETEIDAIYPWEHINEDQVRGVLPAFTGRVMQVPPVFSAVKIDGKRAYKFARKGQEVEIKAKPLEISKIELMHLEGDRLTLRVVCSKGTYIRALARDIGIALGSGAHLTALRRTRVGDIPVEECLSLDKAIEMIESCPLEFPEGYQE